MKLKAAYETDIYLNDKGYCVIDQVSEHSQNDSVWLTYEQAKAVARELDELLTRQTWNSPVAKEK